MIRIRAGAVGLLMAVAAAAPLAAGVRYEFRHTTRSEVRQMPSVQSRGEAWLDGDRVRVEYRGPSLYGDNVTVIANGNRNMWILDRDNRTYEEVNLGAYTRAMSGLPITISNLKSNLERQPGNPVVAGFPTEHWKLSTSYDLRVSVGEVTLEQRVETVIEKWTTQAFGSITDPLQAPEVLRTGNEQLDRLIELEWMKMEGFPLRQTTSITTRDIKPQRRKNRSLDLTAPRRQSSEVLVTTIEFADPAPALFQLPGGYSKQEPKADRTAVTTLTLTP